MSNRAEEYEKRRAEFVKELRWVFPERLIKLLDCMNYFECPAAKKHHGAEAGGLYEHSKNVAKELVKLTEKLGLKWTRAESPIIVGMLHDLCKLNQYKIIDDAEEERGYRIEWNSKNILPGHGEASVYIASELERMVEGFWLTEEEKMCIRYHMGAYSPQEEWKAMDEATKEYPNVIYTHMADMIAAKIIEK